MHTLFQSFMHTAVRHKCGCRVLQRLLELCSAQTLANISLVCLVLRLRG